MYFPFSYVLRNEIISLIFLGFILFISKVAGGRGRGELWAEGERKKDRE